MDKEKITEVLRGMTEVYVPIETHFKYLLNTKDNIIARFTVMSVIMMQIKNSEINQLWKECVDDINCLFEGISLVAKDFIDMDKNVQKLSAMIVEEKENKTNE